VRYIAADAFANCSSLAAFDVAEGNRWYSSEDGVLFNADKTVLIRVPEAKRGAITIPESVVRIQDGAFLNCRYITEVNFNAANCVAADALGFSGALSVAALNIGAEVTRIPANAFTSLWHVGSLTVPNSVAYIGSRAFERCAELTELFLGSGVTHIGDNAFGSCVNLRAVTSLHATPPAVAANAFRNVNAPATRLYVTPEGYPRYLVADVWKDFDIVALPFADVNLASLSVSHGALSPAFSADVTEYSFIVENAVTALTIAATASDPAATVTGAGDKTLSPGLNLFPVIVASPDGFTAKTYMLAITRQTTAFTVEFNTAGGSPVAPQTVEHGDLLTQPANPQKDGAIFSGWYREAEYITAWNFATDAVTGALTLHAKWTPEADCTNCNDHGCEICQPPTYDCTHCNDEGCEHCQPPTYDCEHCNDAGCEICQPPTYDCEHCNDEGCEICQPPTYDCEHCNDDGCEHCQPPTSDCEP
jgi:uncharacterized repeat protein (TIGR02543 family)